MYTFAHYLAFSTIIRKFMSLYDCPDCKTKISTKAVSCPKCGYTLYFTALKIRRALIGFSGATFSFLILINTIQLNGLVNNIAFGALYFSIALILGMGLL